MVLAGLEKGPPNLENHPRENNRLSGDGSDFTGMNVLKAGNQQVRRKEPRIHNQNGVGGC